MTYIVDNSPIGIEPLSKEDMRDQAEERDQEEYEAMYDQVEAEMLGIGQLPEYQEPHPGDAAIHAEVMRRLREKYESACGE